MKQNSLRSGFTLVELLIVIAIIAILSGLSAVSYGSFAKSAKKKQSEAIVHRIVAAIEQYHTEYGSFPPPVRSEAGAEFTFDSDDANMTTLLSELTGADNATINYKNKNFLPLDNAKGDANGITLVGGAAAGVADPFGNPYTLVFNSNYSTVGLPIPAGYVNAGANIQAKVIVYNNGQDEESGTKDDVLSWN